MKRSAGILFWGLALLALASSGAAGAGYDPADYLVAPLRIHLLADPGEPDFFTTLTEEDVSRIVAKIDRVWSQAGLGFYIEGIVREMPAPADENARTPRRALVSRIRANSYSPECFNVYYLKRFDVNGIFFPEAIFVQDTASLREVPGGIDEPLPRVTSHELGHALGLPHRQETFNLMASGTTGFLLNAQEIEITRARARELGRFKTAADVLSEAEALFASGKTKEAALLYRRLADLALPSPMLSLVQQRAGR